MLFSQCLYGICYIRVAQKLGIKCVVQQQGGHIEHLT